MSEGLEVKISNNNKGLLVHLIGRISHTESNQFQSQLSELLEKSEQTYLFDCSELSFISSSGLRAILQFAKQIPDKGKKIGFFALQEAVLHVFDISGFTKILNIYKDKQQAEKELG